MPRVFRAGEAFQFDWSGDYAVIGGERTKLRVAHMKRSHNRTVSLRIDPDRLVVVAEGRILCEHRRREVRLWLCGPNV